MMNCGKMRATLAGSNDVIGILRLAEALEAGRRSAALYIPAYVLKSFKIRTSSQAKHS
jgi:hypothetical protein